MSSLSDFLNSGGTLAPQVNQNTKDIADKSNDNIFINGDFSVNQRAFNSSVTTQVYTLDRWLCGSSHAMTVNQTASNTMYWSIDSSATFANMSQRIETSPSMVRYMQEKLYAWSANFWATTGGDTITLQMQWRNVTSDTWETQHSTLIGTVVAGENTLSGSITIPTIEGSIEDEYFLAVSIVLLPTDSTLLGTTMWWRYCKLEHSATATNFIPDNAQDNLLKCLRYYWKADNEYDSVSLSTDESASNKDYQFCFIPFPAPLRRKPNTSEITFTASNGVDHAVRYPSQFKTTISGRAGSVNGNFRVNTFEVDVEL